MSIPVYVVMSTIDGLVYDNDGTTKFDDFGKERAFKYADRLNGVMKPEYQVHKVYRLVPEVRDPVIKSVPPGFDPETGLRL